MARWLAPRFGIPSHKYCTVLFVTSSLHHSVLLCTCCLYCMLAISQSQEAMMQTAQTATAAAVACAGCASAGGDCAAHCSCQSIDAVASIDLLCYSCSHKTPPLIPNYTQPVSCQHQVSPGVLTSSRYLDEIRATKASGLLLLQRGLGAKAHPPTYWPLSAAL